MSEAPLPILLSIPHGGTRVPEELGDRVCITPEDLFDDGDAFTADIYDVGAGVARVVKAEIARAFVDLNRAPDERPPDHPDGVVKSLTCLNRPIYLPGREPDRTLAERLLARYYAPYHAELREAETDPDLRLALDCHSMLPLAPPISADPGRSRPLFCLGNREGETAPGELLLELAQALGRAFEVAPAEIGLNEPFRGGYITHTCGGGRLPWIQVEMNRCLYLDHPWFDRATLRVDPGRITELRERFRDALHRLRLP